MCGDELRAGTRLHQWCIAPSLTPRGAAAADRPQDWRERWPQAPTHVSPPCAGPPDRRPRPDASASEPTTPAPPSPDRTGLAHERSAGKVRGLPEPSELAA